MSNPLVIETYCPEISDLSLICHVVDIDAQQDGDRIRIDVTREHLEKVGEMATWRRSDAP